MIYKTKKQGMLEQDPQIRITNFSEVSLGYTEEIASNEALRCLNCKIAPCRYGCPVGIDIPGFISEIKNGEIKKAYKIIKASNTLPAVCGRVCPQENQCERYCVLGKKGDPIGIGRLERFVADYALIHKFNSNIKITASNNRKVAIIGSGPAGLAAAGDLVKLGYKVTIFEALHLPGGVLMYGIPEFRLPKIYVQEEVNLLKQLGVRLEVNCVVGRTITIEELTGKEGFEAVFIGAGAGLPYFMNIHGEEYNGVYSANELLTRSNLMRAYKFPKESATPINVGDTCAVIGGGNVAMDAARTAKRLGAKIVYVIYRRTETEMPARKEEVQHAKEEGICFLTLSNPVKILGNEQGQVIGLECQKMELDVLESSGRKTAIAICNSEFIIDVITVVVAIGQGPNPIIQQTTKDLKLNKKGYIETLEDGQTSKIGVFAGGDIVTGAATVILAMGAGKKTALAIDQYLRNK